MKIFLVRNTNHTVIAVMKTKKKAGKVVKLGKQRWGEKWHILPVKINEIEKWVLDGCEKYRGI